MYSQYIRSVYGSVVCYYCQMAPLKFFSFEKNHSCAFWTINSIVTRNRKREYSFVPNLKLSEVFSCQLLLNTVQLTMYTSYNVLNF